MVSLVSMASKACGLEEYIKEKELWKEDPTLKKLALVPEIEDLIEKAETESQKIERLKREKQELLNYK